MRIVKPFFRILGGVVILSLVAVSSIFTGSVLAARVGGGSGGSSVAGWPSDSTTKTVTWADSFIHALGIGDGNDYWAIYHDPTTGLHFNPVCGGVENGCNVIRKLASTFYWDIINSSDTSILRVTEAGAVTVNTGAQLTASNLGVELAESDTNPTCSSGNYTMYADTSESTIKFCNNGSATAIVTSIPTGDTYVRKTSDETVNNSVTLQNDDALVFAAEANSTYYVKLFMLYDSATAADFRYSFSLPASGFGYKSTHHAPTTTTTCSGTAGSFIYIDVTQTDNNVGGAGTGTSNTCALVVEATIMTLSTAGNIQVQWAQGTLDATNTVVRANSWISYRKIS